MKTIEDVLRDLADVITSPEFIDKLNDNLVFNGGAGYRLSFKMNQKGEIRVDFVERMIKERGILTTKI